MSTSGGGNMDDQQDRTTAIGLLHYAHSYAASAIALAEIRVKATHPDAAVRFLFAHAVELYLKAFCRSQGVRLEELRGRALGHDLLRLLDRASKLGLAVDSQLRGRASIMNDAIYDRYIVTGARTVLLEADMRDMCVGLHGMIAPLIYEQEGIGRRAPVL